ncbi:MAG: GNAT family N-acetyltransferase [Clostridia bacterium]|nr:GNAT family N-acetyltransferase [Clostridia bacterium]
MRIKRCGELPDRTIPFVNVIMKGDCTGASEIRLPQGYALRGYWQGDERAWARMEHLIGDFDSEPEALEYFERTYLADPGAFAGRMTVAAAPSDEVVGACIAWRDVRGKGSVASLHWLIVDPAHQGQGIGRALAVRTMQIFEQLGERPVYIHTQPWSDKAILLYDSLGFCMQRTDTFAAYENQYARAIEVLRGVLPQEDWLRLQAHSEA